MSQGNWKYGRRHPACADCEREFDEGEAHFSYLQVSEEAELDRVDVCLTCWDAREDEPPELWWRSRRHPARKQGLAIDMEGLEAVFHQLASLESERHRELRYVLCLLLMRKRRLLMNRALRRKGGEYLLVRRPRRKEDIEVEVFDLSADRLDEIRVGLQRLFEGEGIDGPGEASGSGNTGSGDPGSGDEASGTGDTGSGDTGSGDMGIGDVGIGDVGTGDVGDPAGRPEVATEAEAEPAAAPDDRSANG